MTPLEKNYEELEKQLKLILESKQQIDSLIIEWQKFVRVNGVNDWEIVPNIKVKYK